MKKYISILFLFSILTLSILPVQAVTAENKKEAGYISLNSTKTKDVEPNFAKITFAVENTSSTAQNATIENNKVSSVIINALKTISSESDVIKTNNFSVRPVYSTTASGKRVIKNYTAVNSVTVETKDTSKVAKFIDIAIENGANRTDGLQYSYIGDKSVCNELYPLLVQELKSQADILAKAAGTQIDGLKHLNASCNTDSVVSNGRFYAKAAMGSMDSIAEESISTPVEAGKVKIRVYVNADFYVK